MKSIKSSALFIILALFLLLSFSLFTVREGQEAIVLRLGKIETNGDGKAIIYQPGLHFKYPIINNVRLFDIRLQTLDIQSSRIVTREKKDVIVDSYVKWRISNLPLYFTRTGGNEQNAAVLLEQQLNDGIRAKFGRRTISEVVSDDRQEIMFRLKGAVGITAKGLGIDVVDVRIKRIDLPTEVSAAVFDRMRAERERVATEHRADGKAAAEAIKADADATVTVTKATARAKGAEIRAKGNAQAASIYSKAFGKDEEFYSFYRSLGAYQQTFYFQRSR